MLFCLIVSLLSIGCDKKAEQSKSSADEAAPPKAVNANTAADSNPKSATDDTAKKVDEKSVATASIKTDKPKANTSLSSNKDELYPAVDLSSLPEQRREQIEYAQNSVREAPGSAERIAELGLHYLAFGFSDAAVTCFETAAERLPNAMKFHYWAALAKDTAGDKEGAVASYRAAIEKDSEYVPAYVNLGRRLLDDNPTEAAENFETARKRDPKDVVAWWGLGRAAEETNNNEKAERYYKAALEIQPDYSDAHAGLARLYKKAGDNEKAASEEKAAAEGQKAVVTNDPLSYEVIRRRRDEKTIAMEAIELAREGQTVQAAKYLEAAIRRDIEGVPIRLTLGQLYLDLGRPNEAAAQFLAGLDLEPNSVELRSNLGRAFAEAGQIADAEAIFRKILAEDSNDAATHNRLGMLVASRGDAAEAEVLLKQAVRLSPNEAIFRINLADLYVNQNRLDDAKAQLEKVPQNSDSGGHRLFIEGMISYREGDKETAVTLWESAVEKSPNLAIGYQALAELAQKAGRQSEALTMYLKGARNVPNASNLLNNAAWILATSSKDELRNGDLAVELAERACEIDGYHRHNFVGTLAAAYAEAGEFDKASRMATRAADLATSAGLIEMANKHSERATLYKSGSPYHE